MQFVTDGPDVPEELLQAQEESRVVFFAEPVSPIPQAYPRLKDWLTKYIRK